jgi:hypothetical protein
MYAAPTTLMTFYSVFVRLRKVMLRVQLDSINWEDGALHYKVEDV